MQDNDETGAGDGTASPHGRTDNPLILKLESLATLSDDDRAVLERISANPQRVEPGTDLIREGDKPNGVYLILDGIACRYKLRASGARQIMAYHVPGDFCDLDVALLKAMDHSISTLSACRVVRIELDTILDLLRHHPGIAHALRLATLVDEATLREWLLNVGRRSSDERIAHLLCELLLRLRVVGRTAGAGYALPITPDDLADTTGLTSVHVNRTLKSLRQRGLIELSERNLKILDRARLEALAEFKANYLHLGGSAAA
jgi:CRP-like cAMP-binding protein